METEKGTGRQGPTSASAGAGDPRRPRCSYPACPRGREEGLPPNSGTKGSLRSHPLSALRRWGCGRETEGLGCAPAGPGARAWGTPPPFSPAWAPTFFADLHLVREFLVLGQFLRRGDRGHIRAGAPDSPHRTPPPAAPSAPPRGPRLPGPQPSPESASGSVHSRPPPPLGYARKPSGPRGLGLKSSTLPSGPTGWGWEVRTGLRSRPGQPGAGRGGPGRGSGGREGAPLRAAPLRPPGTRPASQSAGTAGPPRCPRPAPHRQPRDRALGRVQGWTARPLPVVAWVSQPLWVKPGSSKVTSPGLP